MDPFDVVTPNSPGPVVIDVPHAGLALDSLAARTLPAAAVSARAVVADSDLGAAEIWRPTASVGAKVIVATMSRYVIDLNTEPRVPSAYDDKLPPQLRNVRRRSACGLRWEEPLPFSDEVEARVRRDFEPYHVELERALDDAFVFHNQAILISAHTFPSHTPDDADVVVGTRYGASAGADLRHLVAEFFRAQGLHVSLEDPFPGGYSLARHARPGEGRFGVQLEFARRLVGVRNDSYVLDERAVGHLSELSCGLVTRLADAVNRRELLLPADG
jgi:N-formylglutamate deformylase